MPRPPKKPPGSPRGPAPSTDEGARRHMRRIGARVTPDELAHIDAGCERLGLSREEVIRRGVLAYLYPATTGQ